MTTLKSGLNTDIRGVMWVARGRPYFTNDFDAIQVWNPPASATAAAGIDGPSGAIGSPTQAAGSNTTTGTHLVRYRYLNKETGYISNPSDSLEITVTAAGTDGQLTFGIASSGDDIDTSTDSKVTHIVIEMTAVGGTTYYTALETANAVGSAVVDIADTSLIQQESFQLLYDSFGHEPPPLAKLGAEHDGRVFVGGATARTASVSMSNGSAAVTSSSAFSTEWAGRYIRFGTETSVYQIASVTDASNLTLEDNYGGGDTSATATIYSGTPNRIYWTLSGLPESFKPLERARDVLVDKSDKLNGMASYAGDLWLFGDHSIQRLNYVTNPATGSLIDVPTEMGIWNNDCIIKVSNQLYGFGRAGCWAISNGVPVHISKPIDETVDDLIDRSQSGDFHGCYDPVQRVIRWWFTETGETVPKKAIVYDPVKGSWWLDSFDIGITASRMMPDSSGNLRCMIGDENGYTWFMDGGKADGVASNNPSVITATGTPTTTVIDINETLSTSIASLAGAPVYQVSSGETSYISSHTTSQITLGTALTTAPSSGDTLYIGSFEWSIKTKWFTPKPESLKQPLYLYIHLVPSTDTDASMTVKVYRDYSSTAMNFDIGTGSYTFDDGVTITDGASSCTIKIADATAATDSNGLIVIPLDPTYVRALQAELIMRDPRGTIRLLDVGFRHDREGYDPNE